MIEPYRLRLPADGKRAPLVYDSPHSGRFYPPDLETAASPLELRRAEDAHVDELLASAPSLGVAVLDATYPRCYIDVNRAPTDIDAELLSEPWPTPLNPTEKSARGLGLIRRFVVPGVEINARRLSPREVQDRIDRIYGPYHASLNALIESTRDAFGVVWHLNWHSMKSVGNAMTPDGAVVRHVDAVVSDVDGRSAARDVTDRVVETLRGIGWRVAVNDPYKGGTIVQRIGNPALGVHSIQIEVNRALYLDEQQVTKTSGFATLTRDIESLTRALASAASQAI